ncbi:MAG: hypothetical protein GSR80_001544 [Desulfurococcales archaeon]|nr:hypothetical protein [Desulfurococcales archaeon]
MIPWRSLPIVNMVYEAVEERTAGGDRPVRIEEVSDWVLKRFDYRLSEAELSKSLLTLETLGYVRVLRTGKDVIVKLVKKVE